MDDGHSSIDIDVTRQARTLSWLRLTDYVLIVVCGYAAIGLLAQAIPSLLSNSLSVFELLACAALGYAVYTGWRHVGVIDPRVWRSYLLVFPTLLITSIACLAVLLGMGSIAAVFKQEKSEAIQELSGILVFFWIGGTTLLGLIAVLLLIRQNIQGIGITVDRLTAELGSQAGPDIRKNSSFRSINRTRGILEGSLGGLILLINLLPLPHNEVASEALLRINRNLLLLGFYFLIRARRFFQPDADSVLSVDQRPPILFLRSFDDDEKQSYSNANRAFFDFSLETRLTNYFSSFGPFIAIGSPKEKIPQLGAARVLLPDDQWQDRVLDWMQRSQAIVMYSGKTRWVNWELQKVIESGAVTRLILMMPELKRSRQARRIADAYARVDQMRGIFDNTPWRDALHSLHEFEGLRAIGFRPDGSIVVVRSRSRQRDSYHLAAMIAHRSVLDSQAAFEAARPTASGVFQSPAGAPDPVYLAPAPTRSLQRAPIPVWRSIAAASAVTVIALTAAAVVLGKDAMHSAAPSPAISVVDAPADSGQPGAATRDQPAAAPTAAANPAPDQTAVLAPASPARGVSSTPADPVVPRPAAPQETAAVAVAQPRPPPSLSYASSTPPAPDPEPAQETRPVAPDPLQVFVNNAQVSMSQGRYAAPADDCALYWARQLEQRGDSRGATLEKQAVTAFASQIDLERGAKNYTAALSDLDHLLRFYPSNVEMLKIRVQMENEQRAPVAERQLIRFTLQHRHMVVDNNGQMGQAYCIGVLTVAQNGVASFDCTGTFDPQGRCDHVLFQFGAIKEVKFLANGLLHVATHHQGNYDFYGDSQSLLGAFNGLHALASK